MPSRVLRQFAHWIALLAIVAVTAMPTVSRLLAAGRDGADVCTAELSHSSGSGEDHLATDHCPYCALHADLAPPPSPATAAALRVLPLRAQPLAFLRAPRATSVWSTSQPRAPPALA